MTITASPLTWPTFRPRTPYDRRRRNAFQVSSVDTGIREVAREVRLLGGKGMIISTNLPTRRDGFPYSGVAEPKDPGVAVYFTLRGKDYCFACDTHSKVAHNLRAVAKTIEAIRGIERWGSGSMVEQAFTGFEALPNPDRGRTWREVLGLPNSGQLTAQQVESAYRQLRSATHPDRGGSSSAFIAVQDAYDRAMRELA